jgi:hypothetical protein
LQLPPKLHPGAGGIPASPAVAGIAGEVKTTVSEDRGQELCSMLRIRLGIMTFYHPDGCVCTKQRTMASPLSVVWKLAWYSFCRSAGSCKQQQLAVARV